MSSTLNIDDLSAIDLSLICRGCLATSGEMKNMVEWGLLDEFYKLTNVQVSTADNPSLLLCVQCEDVIHKCRSFKATCQKADELLRTALEKKLSSDLHKLGDSSSTSQENSIHTELTENQLIIKIIAPHMDSKINLPCLYCNSEFLKRTDLMYHLVKQHKVIKRFNVDLKYYCHIKNCSYHISSGTEKHFTGRKYLNQHIFKVHRDKIICDACNLAFFNDVDFKRHLKTCNSIFMCQACDKPFKTYESFLVHLLRKHPELHKQYMVERKAEKRGLDTRFDAKKVKIKKTCSNKTDLYLDKAEKSNSESNVDTKKIKTDKNKTESDKLDKSEFFCDSPKRSFATQTLDFEKHIKNDVTLPSWQAEKSDDTKKDEMSTQTVFEDLLSLKSNMSEDDAMFSDSVSLSDIQTQTLPLEFGLSRSNKETITSETQSPDLSIKETQTCLCLYDSPKPNFRCTESVSSSPSTFNMLTSTETQTLDLRGSFYNDFLSFSSAETQTCFDDDGNKDL
ncbi:uncharacterized protein LOC123879689 isoform X1 [Maniola jurtina]|uniref:uncharacterized protein LOC123879689 isoform X1 n=1 Tax=Maniola jurtina TaxID=191418 RepID=UPI001E689FA2|nr:uncharacterized protein LOC123879689 isoform X1 [Maniola jurtina]